MAKSAFLEAFEIIDGGASTAPSDDWMAGYSAGLADAMGKLESDQKLLADELVQTLSDLSFGYHEALTHLSTSLESLFRQLAEKFVPDFGHAMLVPVIIEALSEAANSAMRTPVVLAVSPGQADQVADAIARISDPPVTLRPDPALHKGQAILKSEVEETMIDFASLILQSQSVLGALLDTQTQRTSHG